MNQKVIYSMMGLAALPIGAEAAVVQAAVLDSNWSGTQTPAGESLVSADGSEASYKINLLPGKYTLSCDLTTKVYNVDVTIAGVKQTFTNSSSAQKVNMTFTLNEAKEVTLSFVSSDPGEAGAGYSFTAPVLSLDYDFASIKSTLANNAQTLATTISGYNYAAKQEDVEAANKLKKKAQDVAESYDDYKKFKLYAEKSTIQEEIDALADKAAKAEAAYQNEQAYNRVNQAITEIKGLYNTAVAQLEEELVGAAAYLLDGAKDKLNTDINLKITEATSASYASYQAGTAVADEATNTGLVPTQGALNSIVSDYMTQSANNKAAYKTLDDKVKALQTALDNVKVADGSLTSTFAEERGKAQDAITGVKTTVEGAYNKAAQLTLDISAAESAAQSKINTLAGKINTANAEFNANKATTEAIAKVQKALNDTKGEVNQKVSKDGNYKAADYYTAYLKTQQDAIDKLTSDAAKAYKVDGTGSAQTYNAGLAAKTAPITSAINTYKTNAIAAVNKYDALQDAINGTDKQTGYQDSLNIARQKMANLAVYTDPDYDYKTQLDLIQKRINDIKKAIAAANEKVGAEHWTAMLGIDPDAAIITDITVLINNVQADQNQYDKDYLDNGLNDLATSITSFGTTYATDGNTKLGADYAVFAAAETNIATERKAIEDEKKLVDPTAADAASKIQALGARITALQAEQTALEAAATFVAAKVAANGNAKSTLGTNISNLQTKIGTFKTTYKIGQDDSTLGNRGKATGSITTEVSGIETALSTLKGDNDGFDPTVIKKDEKQAATSGLALGIYDVEVEVEAKAAGKVTVNGVVKDYAKDKNTYKLENVIVSKGTLTVTVNKDDKVSVKKLTYHENDLLNKYNNVDPKPNEAPDEDGYAVKFNKLLTRESALETAAPGIKEAVAKNASTKTAANKAVSDLQTAELNTLKSLKNVTNANAVSDDTTAKKADPANWKVFESGLDAGKSYTAKKAAIDADITAMSNAIAASAASETLVADWKNNSITVGTGDNAKTYSISALTDRINALKNEAKAESDNWEAYKSLQDNNMPKLLPDTITVNTTVMGDGAVAYYQGLKNDYISGKAAILTNMQADLNARKAVSTKDGFVSQINALIDKVKVLKSDGEKNLKKYKEQKAAGTNAQDLWNSTYTEIAATDHSSKVQDYLKELDDIQVTLTAAKDAVEANYKVGKSVAEAKDFAAIEAAINDVKARQTASYSEFVTADNKAAHESFMGTETTKGAIQLATEAYQRAVQDRAKYSSTNEDIKAAVDAAAATLDAALYDCPTQIQTLTKAENDAYVATVSPTVFDVSSFNTQALQIEQDITTALNNFKTAVKAAINDNVWSPKKSVYSTKLSAAETAISSYSDDAKKDAFKDVKDQIAKGDAGVNEWTLSKVEEAIAALEDIDNMLAADKDAAAAKDLTARFKAADDKYDEVKKYIDGISNNIPEKAEELDKLETAYEDVIDAKEEDKTFANRNGIKSTLDTFLSAAGNCKTTVENAVKADNDNTAAYNAMMAAITPVEAKLAEAKSKAAQYKYETTFAGDEGWLEYIKDWAEDAKEYGYAVADKEDVLNDIKDLDADIDITLTLAFGNEKSNLAADIAELKNQYNAYVAANGLDETATAFKADIEALEKAVNDAVIKDLDETPDGIQYDEILGATDALIKLQNNIADKETELLAANASGANANVLADFTAQLDDLNAAASVEYAEWVGEQIVDGKTIDEQITALKAGIADLKAAIEAEPNISFYKDQYQKQITAIEEAITPVAAAITAKQAQFDANAAAYATLSEQIKELQGKIDAAKAKVGEYEFAASYYIDYIEQYYDLNDPELLTGGVQYVLNNSKAAIETANNNKALNENSVVANKASIENDIQYYLDRSAYYEIYNQRTNLNTLLTYAIESKYVAQKYSPALWNRLQSEKNSIYNEIVELAKAIYCSNAVYEGSFDVVTTWGNNVNIGVGSYPYYYTLDEEDNRISRSKSCDADYEVQMAIVNAIKAKIASLSDAVDNLSLLGDANEDGRVNVLDYQKVINMILDPTLQPEEDSDLFANIDVNQSDVIEVGDLTLIVNYILNKEWQGWAAVKSYNFNGSGERVSMTTSKIQPDVLRVAVNLANVNDYTAFQLDMVLPNGMSIVGTSLTERAGQSHKLYSRTQLDGSVRLLASSINGDSFSGSEGAVLYIDVKTTDAFKGGSVELLNILFSDTNATTRAFSIGTSDDATGIDIMAAMESLKQKVYDLSGRMMDGVKKGINIIKRADGTTQKVMKK